MRIEKIEYEYWVDARAKNLYDVIETQIDYLEGFETPRYSYTVLQTCDTINEAEAWIAKFGSK